MTLALKNKIVNNHNLARRVFRILAALLAILFAGYLFFTGRTILDVIARRAAENSARALAAEVSKLELQYISADNNLDLNYARILGFSEAKKIYFVRRAALVGSLSASGHEL